MIFGHKAASIPSYTDFFNQGEVYNYFPCKEMTKETLENVMALEKERHEIVMDMISIILDEMETENEA